MISAISIILCPSSPNDVQNTINDRDSHLIDRE